MPTFIDLISHGDMLFVDINSTTSTSGTNQGNSKQQEDEEQKIDAVDIELAKQDGWIKVPRDPKYCQHGPNGQCVRCMPIPVSFVDKFSNHKTTQYEHNVLLRSRGKLQMSTLGKKKEFNLSLSTATFAKNKVTGDANTPQINAV